MLPMNEDVSRRFSVITRFGDLYATVTIRGGAPSDPAVDHLCKQMKDWLRERRDLADVLAAVQAGPRFHATCCGSVIQSRHRHDIVWCWCNTVAVDGGSDYVRIVGNADVLQPLDEEYDDDTDEGTE